MRPDEVYERLGRLGFLGDGFGLFSRSYIIAPRHPNPDPHNDLSPVLLHRSYSLPAPLDHIPF